MLSKMNLLYFASILASLHFVAGSNIEGNALYEMKRLLNASDDQLPDWNKDRVTPCTWKYVKCDDDNNIVLEVIIPSLGFNGALTPQIGALQHLTILSLQGNNITGGIPEELGNLSSLKTLNLESNLLSGDIPASLGKLTKLQKLALDQNKLSGKIPESFSNLQALNDISLAYNDLSGQIPDKLFQVNKYNFTGNNLNCGTNFQNLCASSIPDSGEPHASKLGPMLGGVLGSIVILVFVVIFFLFKRRILFKRDDFFDVSGEGDWKITLGQLRRFTFRELQVATDNFSEKNVLGQGGFGKVYKGVLLDDTKIAIKRMTNFETAGGEATFLREVEMISVAVHKNLLRLIGFCTTPTERILVYPFMQNLSLAYRLRDIKVGEAVLDWDTRKQIALGTARGIEYLHQSCNPKIIHRDVKAANVLLDENFQAVVGDFGLAKLVDVRKTSVTTRVCGTMGHIAPEYLSTGKSSEKTDVFGYGIMLLELVTGQRAIDLTSLDEDDEVLLLDLVKRKVSEKRLDAIVDRNLDKIYNIQEMEMIIQVALLCTQSSPEERPTMSEVIRMLEGEGLADRWEEWQQSEMARRQENERIQQRVIWGEDSMFDQEAIELSGGR